MSIITSERNYTIDFLRAIAVFLVLFNHLHIRYDTDVMTLVLYKLKTGGWVGVDLFFVLSGFLVSGLIFKEYEVQKSFDPKTFLIRRGLKIYPLFYCLILFTALILLPKLGDLKSAFLSEIFFVSNYVERLYGHTWSLCIEEHFYLLLAILMYYLIKKNALSLGVILGIYLFFVITCVSLRYYAWVNNNEVYDFYKQYARSHLRFDSLFFGVLISYLFFYHKEYFDPVLNYKILFGSVSATFILLHFVFERAQYHFISVASLSLNPIFFGVILVLLLSFRNNIYNRAIYPFAVIGRYSYSIYLFHEPVNEFMHAYFFKQYCILYYVSYFALSVFVGVLLGKIIEYPFLRFRDRVFPSKSSFSPPVRTGISVA